VYSFNFLRKGLNILIVTVNGGKTNVCHNINLLKTSKNHLAYLLGRDFAYKRILKLGLNRRGDLHSVAGALLAGALNTDYELMFIKEFGSAVALDYRNRHRIHNLVGSESFAAGWTFAAAPDAATLVYGT
jgi:hypothetical protein